jgi:hypothetical protein
LRACSIQPEDRRKQLDVVGKDLVKNYGKKKYYSVMEVKNANKRQGVSLDIGCWSHAAFNNKKDFDDFHKRMGEDCDYTAMKTEMFGAASHSNDNSFFDADSSWLDLLNVDLSDMNFFD